ncbi:hypothetical protein WAF17_21185 [Bernardetia sp. ABR2-2B]|uniref:hypothetical protein n=1 Tax=Bernardetia sp. ABR2-2B TaxID=3127472 RepID=UPI0030D25F15
MKNIDSALDLARLFGQFRELIFQNKERITIIAANAVLASLLERIFEKGKATDGSKIGKYDTKEIWISIPVDGVSNSGLKRIGKPKGKPKKAKETKSTMYFPKGYKEFKDKTGRQSNKVNLYLTGDLFLSIKVGKNGDANVIGIVGEEEKRKAEGNEKRFGKDIFSLSNKEKQLYFRTINKEVQKLFKQIFQ